MRKAFLFSTFALMITGCATVNESLELGSGLGGAAGAVATYAGYSAACKQPQFKAVAIGAGVGAVIGLATAYFTHKKLAEDREAYQTDQFEMHFGDLPPSPFIIPKQNEMKGAHL